MKSTSNIKGDIRRGSHFKPMMPSPWSFSGINANEWTPYLSSECLKMPRPTLDRHTQYMSETPEDIIRLWRPEPIFWGSNISKKKPKSQIDALIDELASSFTFINRSDIITFLEENEVGIDEIFASFTEVNKQVSLKFPKNVKMFVQKYDDPETHDHFISIDVRHKDYPDDFIDKIWEIRDIFSEKFTNNLWLLITTDYKPMG